MHVTFCDFSLLYSGKGESAMMKISPVRLVFAWTCLLLFGTENSDAASNLLRGQWEREEFPAASASPPTQRHLIIGGKIAIPNDYPYFAHLEGIACGGSLIAPDVVLTAGHCKLLSPKEYGQVYVGRHDYRNGGRQDGVELFNVQNHFRHPDYIGQLCCGYNDGMRFNGVSHDFMLLKLDGMSTKTVVSLETNSTSPVDDQELYLMGFGDINANPNIYVEPDRLFEVTLNYLSNEECASSSIYPLRLLPSETLCATDQRQDGCQGDSGGPLIIKGDLDDPSDDIQVGVTSWGWDCGQQPGVFARVSEGYDWIRKQVCNLSDNPPASFNCPTRTDVSQPAPQQQQLQQPTKPPQSLISLTQENIDPSYYFTSSTRPRSSLPEGTPCRSVKDAQVCCSSRDSSSEFKDQLCLPAPPDQLFPSGNQCEAAGWVKEYANQTSTSRFSNINESICNAIMDDRKIQLSALSSCSRMASKRACCMAKDSDGNPCIPSRGFSRFSSGARCESSLFVAHNQPENTGSCSIWG